MEQIKALREKTGAGMVDCKKALEESGGDLDKAVEILRKKGIAKATKRTDREASEGLVLVAVNDEKNEGYILEVNSETDFVSRNDKFKEFSQTTLDLIKNSKPTDLETLLALQINGLSVKDTLDALSGTIGEKLSIKNFAILTGATVASYSHLGGRIGVLVALSEAGKSELAGDIAMQVAASNPRYLLPEEVPMEEINKEKEIYREQLLKEGKPEQMIEKIAEGKINKYYSEVCLLKQEFIKDDKKTVEDILGGVKIDKFIRYSL
ncbi:MAG: translation elongation factor Ts [Patescibacteria group bacterium]|jgi:elongation factor Ts